MRLTTITLALAAAAVPALLSAASGAPGAVVTLVRWPYT